MVKAIVIVDMLNDFVKEDGALPVAGAQDIIENIGKIKGKAEEYNVLVVCANDAHEQDDVEFKVWPVHAVKGTYGAKVTGDLAPVKGNLVMEKQDLSMFTNKQADALLKQKDIDELYVTGVATEYCDRALVLTDKDKYGNLVKGALDLGYEVNVVVDAIAGADLRKGDQNRALLEMGNAGAKPKYTG